MFAEKCRAAEANIFGATKHAHATHCVKNTEKEHCFLTWDKRKISALIKMLNQQISRTFHSHCLTLFFH